MPVIFQAVFARPRKFPRPDRHGVHIRPGHFRMHPPCGRPWKRVRPAFACPVPAWPGYYYEEGRFFRVEGGYFVPVSAPTGIFIPQLPRDVIRISHRGMIFYVADGNFFQSSKGGFVAVPIPGEVCLRQLPAEEQDLLTPEDNVFLFRGQLWKKCWLKDEFYYRFIGYNPS